MIEISEFYVFGVVLSKQNDDIFRVRWLVHEGERCRHSVYSSLSSLNGSLRARLIAILPIIAATNMNDPVTKPVAAIGPR